MFAQRQMMDRVHGHNPIEYIRFERQVGNIGNNKQSFVTKPCARFFQRSNGNICTEAIA